MTILTWIPDNLNGISWNSFATQESDEIDVEVEHPNGNAKTATVLLGIRSEGRSFHWYVKLKSVGDDPDPIWKKIGNWQCDFRSNLEYMKLLGVEVRSKQTLAVSQQTSQERTFSFT